MMVSIPIFLPTFRREIVLTAGLVLWWAPIANSHRDAAFEYDLGSLSKSFFMATSPTDSDVYLYSPDHLTVLDQKLQEQRTSACKLNSSSLSVGNAVHTTTRRRHHFVILPALLQFGGGRFYCQNSRPVNAGRINCGNLAETETTVQLDVGTSPLLSSRLHARDPPPWSTNVSKDTRMSCMQRVLQFENMELDLPAGSRYLYGYKADGRSLFAVILKNKEVERNEDYDQFITELRVYGLQETKWYLQGSRVLKCVKTEDNRLVDFEQATAAIAIRQHSSEQFPGTSANVLYVAFHMQTNMLDAAGSDMRDDSSLCRFVLDDFKGWKDQLNEWRAHEMVSFPYTTVLSLRTALLDNKPILVAHERQLISLINISWKTSQNSNWVRELEYLFNDANRTQVRQIETSMNWIHALTDKKVLKLDTDRCGHFRDCHDCVADGQNRNVFCGWCSMEQRCSTQASCQSAFDDEKRETAPELWLNTWSKEPSNCPIFSPRSSGYFTIAVDDETITPDSAKRLDLSTQVGGKRHATHYVARHSASAPFEVMFRADGLPDTGTYLKRLSCEFRFLNRGNFSIENTRVLIRTKTESNLRTRNFHCDMPIRHLNYETFANRPDRQLEGQFQVSLVHTMDDREGSKHKLATSNIRLIDCSTVNLCTYCSGRDVCMWANGKCTTRIKKETGDTIAEDCPKRLSENDQPNGFHIVKIDRKDHSEHPPFEVVLYTYNLKPDADVSQLTVSAGPYVCENLTETENQTLTCSFRGIRNAGSISITVADRTSNAAVICSFCQPFKSSSFAAEPPLFLYEEILLLVAVTVGPVALLILLISLLHVCDKLRKEKAAKNSLGKFKYITIEQARTSEILQTA